MKDIIYVSINYKSNNESSNKTQNFLNNYPFFYTLSFSTNSLLVLEREHLLSEDNPFPRRTIARFTARSSIPITVTARKVEAGGIFVSKGSRYADIPGKLVSFVNWLRGEGGLFLSSRETRRMVEEKGERRKENTLDEERKCVRSMGHLHRGNSKFCFQVEGKKYIVGISIDREEFMKASSYFSSCLVQGIIITPSNILL